MEENLRIAIEFADKIQNFKEIQQIILFGSVAIGEDTLRSDIDIAIVHRSKNKFDFMEKINKLKHEKIQVTFLNLSDLPKETELVGALGGEGILLYGKPINIQSNKINLSSKILLVYSLTDLEQTNKVKLNRALSGSISKSYGKTKVYITKTEGLLKEPGIEKLGKGVLLVDRRKSAKIKNLFRRFSVKFKEMPIWTY